MAVGLVTALASYRLSPPVYPIPDDLTTVGGYLCWARRSPCCFGYSTYNWKQVHLTERQLANEKAQTEGLLRERRFRGSKLPKPNTGTSSTIRAT